MTNTPTTVTEIIARSIEMHPSLLGDAINAARKVHSDYAVSLTARQRMAYDAASKMNSDLTVAKHVLDDLGGMFADDAAICAREIVSLGMGAWVQVVAIAAKLQGIPRHTLNEIVSREA